jgi:hypothetical protein
VLHLRTQQPPKPGVGLVDEASGGAHGHFPHQQYREGFECFGEGFAQALPRRRDPVDLSRLEAWCPRQAADDIAAVLEDVEMPPADTTNMIIAFYGTVLRKNAARLPPERFRFLDPDQDPAIRIKINLPHPPRGTQIQ